MSMHLNTLKDMVGSRMTARLVMGSKKALVTRGHVPGDMFKVIIFWTCH